MSRKGKKKINVAKNLMRVLFFIPNFSTKSSKKKKPTCKRNKSSPQNYILST